MGSTDVREPIPNGFVKLVGFIVLVASATFSASMWMHPVWAAATFCGLFAAVRLLHPEGWTYWVREYWKWNVKGVVEYFHEDSAGQLVRQLMLYQGRNLYEGHGTTEGLWYIMIRRSGWSFLRGWVQVGWDALDNFWSVEPGQTAFVWKAGGPFPNPTTTVRLKQTNGTSLDFSVEQALKAVKTLTVMGNRAYGWSTIFGIVEVRPFNDLLQKEEVAVPSGATSTPTSVV